LSDPNHPNYRAAANAILNVYGLAPDYTREGGSIPIAGFLEHITQMNVLLLPVGASDDMAHSQNEKFNKTNLIHAIKVIVHVCFLSIAISCSIAKLSNFYSSVSFPKFTGSWTLSA